MSLLIATERTGVSAPAPAQDLDGLGTPALIIPTSTPCPEVERLFTEQEGRTSVVVAHDDGRHWYVLARRRFSDDMAGRLGYGRMLYANRTIGALVKDEASPMLDADCDLLLAGRIALARGGVQRYDDLLVRHRDGTLSTVLVAELLRRLAALHEHRASFDPLTGLVNRVSFHEAVVTACELFAASGHEGSTASPGPTVLLIDLDDFKAVNDSLGHPAGDRLLHEVGRRLREAFRAEDSVSRLGGDEFAVLLGSPSAAHARQAAERALLSLSHPMGIEGETVRVGASIGIAYAGDDPEAADPNNLIRNADLAMYEAKRSGKGRVARYRADLHDRADVRLRLAGDLPRAIDHDQLRLDYQPVVDLATGEFVAVEALLRWSHPERGLIPPLQFLPLAERSGAIVPIGAWVLAAASAQLTRWRAEHEWAQALGLSVNVSALQLEDPGFVSHVLRSLAASALAPAELTLELTESAVARDRMGSLDALEDLTRAGVRIAIDDFGTGYSSFARLGDLPVSALKIDRSFTTRVAEGSTGVLQGLLGLAAAMELEVVVEGIETEQQAALIGELGGRLAQGYFFSRPVSPEALADHLRPARR